MYVEIVIHEGAGIWGRELRGLSRVGKCFE